MNRNTLRIITFCCVLMFPFGLGHGIGFTLKHELDEQTRALFQNMIDELALQPNRWEKVLSDLIKKLGGEEQEAITTLRNQMQDLSREVVEDTGTEVRCNADFIGKKVLSVLQQLLKSNQYNLSPWICHVRPEEISIDQKGYPKIESIQLKLTGFGFSSENVRSAQIQIVNEKGKVIQEVPTTANYVTTYRMNINLQGMLFPNNQRNKLRVTWPSDNLKTEASILTPSEIPQYTMHPQWGDKSWVSVGYDKSHKQNDNGWCPNGFYAVQMDLDGNENGMNFPIVGHVKCASLKSSEKMTSEWGACGWQLVGYDKSLTDKGPWCEDGSFIVGLDLDSPEGAEELRPFVGKALCCRPSGNQFVRWGNRSKQNVWYEKSHVPEKSEEWCPDGSFLIQLKLATGGDNPTHQPFVGDAHCASPEP